MDKIVETRRRLCLQFLQDHTTENWEAIVQLGQVERQNTLHLGGYRVQGRQMFPEGWLEVKVDRTDHGEVRAGGHRDTVNDERRTMVVLEVMPSVGP